MRSLDAPNWILPRFAATNHVTSSRTARAKSNGPCCQSAQLARVPDERATMAHVGLVRTQPDAGYSLPDRRGPTLGRARPFLDQSDADTRGADWRPSQSKLQRRSELNKFMDDRSSCPPGRLSRCERPAASSSSWSPWLGRTPAPGRTQTNVGHVMTGEAVRERSFVCIVMMVSFAVDRRGPPTDRPEGLSGGRAESAHDECEHTLAQM
jgi:hypothetical protein